MVMPQALGQRFKPANGSNKSSDVRSGLCNSPVGAPDGSRGIYPTGENQQLFIRHVRDEVKSCLSFPGN
jgi:hypothetical protein